MACGSGKNAVRAIVASRIREAVSDMSTAECLRRTGNGSDSSFPHKGIFDDDGDQFDSECWSSSSEGSSDEDGNQHIFPRDAPSYNVILELPDPETFMKGKTKKRAKTMKSASSRLDIEVRNAVARLDENDFLAAALDSDSDGEVVQRSNSRAARAAVSAARKLWRKHRVKSEECAPSRVATLRAIPAPETFLSPAELALCVAEFL
eukprot:TRINITY_DN34750_c0_g1_i1.p1 TRINITY_DN34750_c0_g1~~TRINITY_DN34750_c0_g1_i1.p1  ORF type:complete len:206 (+),score=33.50 TRINITY_DN34750_c0_g1_i1:79-696(+)